MPGTLGLLALLLAATGAVGAADGLRWPLRHAVGPPGPRAFSVASYGAKPDNRSDSTPAFVAALKAIGLAGGGTLLVPKGGVYLTLPLNLTVIMHELFFKVTLVACELWVNQAPAINGSNLTEIACDYRPPGRGCASRPARRSR